ncbi:MAG: AAA family ATPase, partial [Candidatus Parabeggiatoa sp.]|nr:AAA family ATPase [Candidatus Parabeggiatoa sp.]
FMNTVNALSNTIENNAPVYFLKLMVENVRCFGKTQTLNLSDGKGKPARWTIILGDNGVGKTTLLKCLSALEPNLVQGEQRTEPRVLWMMPKAENIFGRHGKSDFLVQAYRLYKGWFHSKVSSIFKGYSFQSMMASSLPFNELDNFIIYAYGASRRMGSGALEESYNPNHAASLFSEEVSLINAVEWLLQALFASQNSEGDSQSYFENRYEKVKNMLIALLPDIENIRAKPVTKVHPKPTIEVETIYGWVHLRDLSLGYQTLIAWMVDLAHRLFERYPDCDNPLEQPAIVLVDEIDLHLHPKWQRTVISHLTHIFKQTQFIVTAHSPLIVQSAPKDANIVLLKQQGDQVIIHNNEEIIKGWRIDQVLTSDLFDLPSARPFEYDNDLKRQAEILSKPQLTKADEQELEEIGKKLDELPLVFEKTSEDNEANEAMKLIRETAALLKQVNQ